jgi:hypothetical protein
MIYEANYREENLIELVNKCVHLMVCEGSSGEGAWYTRAVTSDSQCSLPISVVLVCVFSFFFLIYVLLLTPAIC